MPFSQTKSAGSQSTMQSCGDFSGEPQPIQAPIPGFSAEQTSSIYQLLQAVFNQHSGSIQQPNSPPIPPPTQPISLAKKKRNQRTRHQYKQRVQAQRVVVQVQEVDHIQELKHLDIQISVEREASKHVVLQSWNVATSSEHAVIPYVGMALFVGMISGCGIGRPRSGVG